jgi:GNAT superfamily N-acetyltransferase
MDGVVVTGSYNRWQAWAGTEVIGTMRAWLRPDQRCVLMFRGCRPDAYPPLLARAVAEFDRDLWTKAGEAELPRLTALGFAVARREHHYRIPTDPVRAGVAAAAAPPGIALVSAADADLDRLRELDDALREVIPGSGGWRWSPEEFREETFSEGFDPATYLVAVEGATGGYVGLVRVWLRRSGARLGCIGVLPPYRRTRVIPALLGTVLRTVHERGHRELVAETDASNRAAKALAARCRAVHTGDSYELVLAHG